MVEQKMRADFESAIWLDAFGCAVFVRGVHMFNPFDPLGIGPLVVQVSIQPYYALWQNGMKLAAQATPMEMFNWWAGYIREVGRYAMSPGKEL